MLFRTAQRLATGRAAKYVPVLRFVAVVQIALLARRHVQRLTPLERRRLAHLVRGGRGLPPAERAERKALTAKLDSRAFAGAAVDQFSPVPLPRRLTGQAKSKRR